MPRDLKLQGMRARTEGFARVRRGLGDPPFTREDECVVSRPLPAIGRMWETMSLRDLSAVESDQGVSL